MKKYEFIICPDLIKGENLHILESDDKMEDYRFNDQLLSSSWEFDKNI